MKKFVSLLISITMLLSTLTAMPVFADGETSIVDNKIVDVDFGGTYNEGTMTDSCGTVASFWKDIRVSSEDAKDGSGTIYYSDFKDQSTTTTLHTTISSSATGNFGDNLTVELWMKGQFKSTGEPVYFNTNGNWTLKANSQGQLRVFKGSNVIITSSKTLYEKDDKWMNIALTRDFDGESTVDYKLYVDGELLGEYTDTAGTALATTNWYFGTTNSDYASTYYGGIADIKVYNDIRTAEEVAADFAAQKSLFFGYEEEHTIFDLDFDKKSDGTYDIIDRAGTVGSFWKTAPEILTLDAKDGSGSIPYAKFVEYGATNAPNGHHIIASDNYRAALKNKKKTSVEMWFNAALTSETRAMPFAFAGQNGGNNKWGIEMNVKYNEVKVYGNGATQIKVALNPKFKTGLWQHIVLTREQIAVSDENETADIKYELYIDGELAGANTVEGTINDGDNSIFPSFGQFYITSSTNYMYNGGLAEAKMYDDVMTADRIKAHYNADKAKYQAFNDNMILDIDFETDDETAVIKMSDKYGINSSYSFNNFAVTTEAAKNKDGNLVYADYSKNAPKTENKYVTINTANAKCFNSENEITIETWMKAQFKNSGAIYMNHNNAWRANSYISSGKGYFEVQIKGGTVKIQNSSKSMNYKDGEWMHLVLTRDFDGESTGVYNAYIDGKLFGTATCTTDTALPAQDIFFGNASSAAASSYNGGIGDIKVYKGIMSAADALKAFNAEKDRYLTFNEQHLIFDASFEGESVSDKEEFATVYNSRNLAYGEEANGTPYLTFDGRAEQYLGFGDADAEYKVIDPIAGNDEASVEFWLRTGDISDKQQNIFALHRYATADSVWGAYIKNGNLVHKSKFSNTASKEISLGGKDKWAHIVLTRKYDAQTGMTYKTYVNGVLADTQIKTDVTPAEDLNGTKAKYLMIGGNDFANSDTTNTFTGDIGAVRLYDGIVSAEQVAATYARESEIFTNGELSVDYVTFYDEEYEKLEVVGENTTIIAAPALSNTMGNDETVRIYVGLYKESGELVTMAQSDIITIDAGADEDEQYLEFTIPETFNDPNGYVKVFVWTGDDFMTPVSSEVASLDYL